MHAGNEHKYKHQHKCVRMVTCERGGGGGGLHGKESINWQPCTCVCAHEPGLHRENMAYFCKRLGRPYASHTRGSSITYTYEPRMGTSASASARALARTQTAVLRPAQCHRMRARPTTTVYARKRPQCRLAGWLALGWMARSIAPCHHHQHHRQSFFMYHHVRPYVRACCVRPCSACPCPCVCVCLYAHAERGPATSLS